METSPTAAADDPLSLYEGLDLRLARREEYYPRREEPDWTQLQDAIATVADRLWVAASLEPAHDPPAELVAMAERPVFILGYYKSGTTLLLNLLDGHPELIALPGEFRYFTTFGDGRMDPEDALRRLHALTIRNVITPYGLKPRWLLGSPSSEMDRYEELGRRLVAFGRARGSRHMLAAVAQALAAVTRTTPRLWVEKTPTQEFHLDRILAAYPKARFVHIVRDPYSTIESIKHFGSDTPIVDVLAGASELSRSFAAAVAGQRIGDRYTVVHYEKLVTETEATMREVAGALGIAYDECLRTPTALGAPATANAGRRENRLSGVVHALSLTGGSGLRWRERIAVEALVGRSGQALGYDTRIAGAAAKLTARAALSARYRIGARLPWKRSS